MSNYQPKPPLGIIPKIIHDQKRVIDIINAIYLYYAAGLKIPVEWIIEYNELVGKK